jgi:hypothetical protein
MQDKFCNVSPDVDKITIAVREKSGTCTRDYIVIQ